jgi:RNA polymerase sigma factor (sigma-70 family)
VPLRPTSSPDDIRQRFLALLDEFGAALMRLCSAYADGPADRDDLFQEICFAIWQAFPRFRGECSLRTFVYRIGHNRGLTFRARSKRHATSLDDVAELEADERPVDELLDERSRADALVAAVRRLPTLQREAIVLHLEGLTPREIADVLGISESNAAVRLTRARQKLRLELDHLTRT